MPAIRLKIYTKRNYGGDSNNEIEKFVRISNKMVKELLENYSILLAEQYNRLFSTVQWKKSWKQARTICFNKVNKPALTTDQLRPISLLPVLEKIYERLFLLRF